MSDSEITCTNLDEAIEHYTKQLGYRLDMIFPADAPREALVSGDGETVRLVHKPAREQGRDTQRLAPALADARACATDDWRVGRAGMEYHDLLPDRMDGKIVVSHIRLTKSGEVADYVHYHKVDFQMIYCKKGRIKVVYEDQGEPFWLETGDCVLQPPEIRHRVLSADAGAEVFEVSMPASHETWVEHEIELPNSNVDRQREFNGQRFVRHIAAVAEWESDDLTGLKTRDTGISAATNGMAHVFVGHSPSVDELPTAYESPRIFRFFFRLDNTEWLAIRIMKDKHPE